MFIIIYGVVGERGDALPCVIHGSSIENILFEDGHGENTFFAFNPSQVEETYSMITVNYFCLKYLGLLFSIDVVHISFREK